MYKILLLISIFVANVFYKCETRTNRVRRIVGGAPAGVPPIDDPIVYIRFAGHNARIRGVRDFPHFVFRGIRYAHPPIGNDRFQRPRQYYLSGDIDATNYPSPCVQPVPRDNTIIGKEDCLFLNVFTPDLPTGTEGLPVVVWIHGGGFRYGSASQYGVRHLVGKRLVIVTIQYRLGSLGFLGTGTRELPGNSALWDMVLAVQWIRNHIGFFGGNPYQIVVMGQGTGASSALLLSLNDVAKGLTSGVIALSGTAVSHSAADNLPVVTAKEVAELQGCPTAVLPMVKCLQAVTAASIIEGDSHIEMLRLQNRGFISGLQGQLGSMPVHETVFDGRSLPPMVEGKPLDKMVDKRTPKIPLLTGITRDETKRAIHGKYQNEIVQKLQSIPHFLDQVLLSKLQTFTGLFKQKSTNETMSNNSFWHMLDTFKFRNYIKISKNNIHEGLGKIAEVTADALFNLPAFLTVDLWTKSGAPAFLYRFEHLTRKKRAHHFLQGLPIVCDDDVNDTVAHGDDLAYLFEARSLNGTPIANVDDDFSDEDHKVREIFTNMISTFARHGKINIDNQSAPCFSSDKNNYMQISAKPKLINNFRFCELALWAGITERLQSSLCSLFDVLDSQIKNVEFTLFDTVQSVGGKVQEQIGDPMKTLEENIHKTEDVVKDIIKNPFGFLGSKDNKQENESTGKFKIFGG